MQRMRKVLHTAVIFSMLMTLVAVAFPATVGAANLIINPTTFVFPATEVGTTSLGLGELNGSPGGVQVLNNGNVAVPINNVVSNNPGRFEVTGNGCLGAILLAPGQSCTFDVVFSPNARGTVEGEIEIQVGGGNPNSFLTVSGAGIDPIIDYTPDSPFTFPPTQIGQTSAQQVIEITNTGLDPITFTGPITSTGSADFAVETVSGFTCPLNAPGLAPGASCQVRVSYTPSNAGPENGALAVIYTNSGGLVASSYALNGTGVQASVSADPNPRNFGDQLIGSIGAPRLVTFSNDGIGPVTITNVFVGGPDAADFQLLYPGANNCFAGAANTLQAGQECEVWVRFAPATTAGPKNAFLSFVIANAPAGVFPAGSYNVQLNGTATNTGFEISPSFLDFGSQQVGTVSNPLTVTVTNNADGGIQLPAATFTVNDPNAGGPHYLIQQDGCNNAFLAEGESCTFEVVFTPQSTGLKNATIQNAGGQPVVQLRGVGVLGGITVTPNPHDFGDVEVGTSEFQTFTVTNAGTGPVTITGFSGPAAPYTLESNSCIGQTLTAAGPGNTCTFVVRFSPTVGGLQPGQVTINYNGGVAGSFVVSLLGTGIENELDLTSPVLVNNTYDFGDVVVGQSAFAAFTFTNNGNGNYGPIPAVAVGPTPPFYNNVFDSCSTQTLSPGESCTVIVRFMPNAAGEVQGFLSVNPVIILVGNGVSPNGALSANQPQLSFGPVQVGTQSAVQPVIVSNNGNVPVQLDPAGAVVLSDPSSYVVQGGVATTCQNALVLDPGASCVIWVAFQPDGSPLGNVNATLTVNYISAAVAAGDLVILLNGIATTANGEVNPLQLDFGAQEINTTSGAQTVVFRNTGLGPINVPTLNSAGPNGAEFLIQSDSCSGTVVLSNGTCQFSVVFRPTSTGAKNAQIAVGALPNSSVVTLKGVGVDPLLTVEPIGPVDFGTVIVDGPLGQRSLRTFTFRNTGSNDVTVPAPIFTGDYALEATDCFLLNPLGPGASCQMIVRFDPQTAGPSVGTMVVNPVVQFSGLGVAANGALSVSPPQLTFDPQQIGTQSGVQQIIVSNNGNIPAQITGLTVFGPDYILTSGAGNTCVTGVVLDPGESCALWVAFQPTAPAGAKNSQVDVNYASTAVPAGVVSVLLRGTATTANGSVSPLQLDFGPQEVGTLSAPRTVTFTNTGSGVVVPTVVAPAGANFAIQSDLCSGKSVLPGLTCTVSVVFQPQAEGPFNDTIAIDGLVVTLKGVGIDVPLTITPSDYDFGSVVVGQTAIHSFVVRNAGQSPHTITAADIIVAGAGFTVLSQDCTTLSPLGPGEECTIVVQFAPGGIGQFNGTLTVNPIATLHGTGIAAGGALTANPVQLSFGNIQIGSMSAVQTITFTNPGASPVTLTSLPGLNGPNFGDFVLTVAGNSCQIGMQLGTNESCSVSVAFRPQGPGPREAWVTLLYNSSTVANGVVSVLLRGVGITPVISVNPTQLIFDPQTLNTASPAKTVVVQNSSNGPITLGALVLAGPDFQIVGNLCNNATLAAGATCQFSVFFLPTGTTGPKTGTVTIPVAGLNDVVVSLFGQATAAQQGGVSFNPVAWDFGFRQIASPSAAKEIILTNNGNAVLNVADIAIAGPGAINFGPLLGDNCEFKALNPGQSCSVWIRFRPLTTGLSEAWLVYNTDLPGSPHAVYLYGVGITPVLTISPVQLNFGNLQVGSTSTPQSVTVTNTGSAQIELDITGPAGGDFEAVGFDCSVVTLAPGGSCTFSVVFHPTATGLRSGAMDVEISPGGMDFEVDLLGVGLTATGMVSPLQLDFGNIQVGVWSAPQTVTFTNTGSGPIGPLPVTALGGPHPGDFQIQTDLCQGAVIQSGGACTISFIFRPSIQGPRNATVEVGLPHPILVTLKGNGIIPSPQFLANAVDFGTQPLNVASTPRRVTVTNNGQGTLLIFGAPTITGANAADFSIFTSTCTDAALATGQSCYVDVVFKPLPPLNGNPDIRTAVLNFTTNMPTALQTVPLTGQVGQFSVNVVVGANACLSAAVTPAGPYSGDAEVTATATVAANSVFIGWMLDGYYVGFANPIDFKMNNSSHTIEAVCVAKPTFSDIAGSPYQTAIEQMAAFGFIKGYFGLSGPYGPNDNVLRSQMAVILVRMANRTNAWSSEVHANPFSDQCSGSGGGCVDAESWAAVATGYEKQVIRGLGFGVFAPFANVTEMESVAFVTRMMQTSTLELEQHGRLPGCPNPQQGIPAPAPLGPAVGCAVPPEYVSGQSAAKATKWESQPNNATIYGSVPDGSGFRKDISTYFYYAGVVPGTGNQFNAWSTWASPAKRQQIAAILWNAYSSYWGTDRVDELP